MSKGVAEMVLDDDDQKIRRNLVVYSALIVSLTWLDLPLGLLLDQLLPEEITRPADYKILALSFAILAYLGMRFSFGEEGKNYRETMARANRTMVYFKCKALVRLACQLYTRFGLESRMIQGGIEGVVKQAGERVHANRIAQCGRPDVSIDIRPKDGHKWRFDAGADVTWRRETKGVTAVTNITGIEVQIFGFARLLAIVWAKVHGWTYTENTVRYLAPVTLGLLAAAVLGVKLAKAYAAI